MKDKRQNLKNNVDLAMGIAGQRHMCPVIEKELLHYDILA